MKYLDIIQRFDEGLHSVEDLKELQKKGMEPFEVEENGIKKWRIKPSKNFERKRKGKTREG